MKKIVLLISVSFIYLISCTDAKGPLPIVAAKSACDSTVHYSSTIAPIIIANCLASHCHNAGSVNGDYTSYAGLQIRVNDGTLNSCVVLRTGPDPMPAAGPLSDADKSKINCWIQQGGLNN
jgi:hypothetical protein